MLDAYAVKKAIPRVVLAVIAINLSIYLCIAAIDITTVIGRGLNDLLVTPFINQDSFEGLSIPSNFQNNILGVLGTGATLAGLIAVLTTAGGFVWLLGLLLPLIITVSLIALAVLFTLIIRQGLLIFLTVVSPIAIACYILPGTEKYFKQWWDLFLKTLLVYPIIAAIFAMCNVLAAILLASATGSASMIPGNYFAQPTGVEPSATIGTLQVVVAILVLYMPLVLIPFAFKMAGGAIAAVMNAASGRATTIAGRAGQAVHKSRQDPNSMLGKAAMDAKGSRSDRGLTGRQLWARRPGFGGKRQQRIGAAKELDQFINREASKETHRAKLNAQDSDIQDSLVMSSAAVERDKASLAARLSQGDISQQEYSRKMRAHALADQMGRTTANRQAAFLNQERIKFSDGTGTKGYKQERALAQEIFGDDASTAAAMNAHQAIATGVGRADLAQALYGNKGNPTRGSAKAGASQIMQGHELGVKGSMDDHLRVINDSSATTAQKTQAAQFLANMVSTASSPYGAGNEANKRMVLERRKEIEEGFEAFATDPTTQDSYLHADTSAGPSGTQITERLPDGREVTRTVPGEKLTGAEAAFSKLQRMAQAEIDPAKTSSTEPPKPDDKGGGDTP